MNTNLQSPISNPQSPCGCCEGIELLTPLTIANRPGLDALRYRVGTHATFLETMKARLSGRDYPALRGLTTRAANDPAIALLDAWATVADVLTFYQERIANEGYLRTATERRSILELARLVGYALRLGVAASVYLAYTLDDTFKDEVEIPLGARSQSLPGPGELPQSFETSELLKARAAWNNLQPRLTRPQNFVTPPPIIYLKGVATNLKPNDPLVLIDFLGTPSFQRVQKVEIEPAADRTKVTLVIKAAGDLNLLALETLIRPGAILEEEGPYSVVIGDRAAREIKQAVENLLGRLRDKRQPVDALRNAVLLQLPRLEQTIRILSALNFDHLATWAKSVRQQLVAIVRQLEARLAAPPAPVSETIDPYKGQIEGLLEKMPTPPKKAAFSREIAAPELQQVQASLSDLDNTLALRAEALALDQLRYVFDELGFKNHSQWAGDLSKLLNTALPQTPPPTAPPAVPPLLPILRPLLRPPSRPPANALRLTRSVKQVFARESDIQPRLLTTLQPALRPILYRAWRNFTTTPVAGQVYALRVTASLFGHNAPKRTRVNPETGEVTVIGDWPIIEEDETERIKHEEKNVVQLDASYDKILPDSWIVVETSNTRLTAKNTLIAKARKPNATPSRAQYGLTGKTTRIELALPSDPTRDVEWITADLDKIQLSDDDFEAIRRTVVYAQSEELTLAEEPIDPLLEPVEGHEIELADLYDGLEIGRWLIVSGERADLPGTSGVAASELVMLDGVKQDKRKVPIGTGDPIDLHGDRPHTFLQLSTPLAYTYKRDTVTIYGNVVKATHGETRNEVLGSGDGSKALQSFTLKQPPLTYVSAPNPSGVESTLQVRVNDILWRETDMLNGLQPTDRRYVTRTDDESKTTVIFGNGQEGARLSTGVENVRAVYRNGIGKPGNVKAGQISLLATRPLGVKSVINPLRASGGADRESRDQARRNAPLAVMALDRLVSVQDYADFARTFAGIGKAIATRLSDGRRQVIHVTIAGADDIPIETHSDLYQNLRRALRDFGDPFQPIQLDVRELLLLVISAKVRLHPDYLWEKVEPKIRAALLETFSFERRELGQDVLLSEVISVIQRVPGVAYVDVDTLGGIPEKVPDEQNPGERRTITPEEITQRVKQIDEESKERRWPSPRVSVNLADFEQGAIRPAQLAFLTPEVPATLILNGID